ncbi:hypothetical protein BT69DRAFT_1289125 [Atractiella rhizophila]|nr:hypothetical protein BT69DRAFT_1289125 [Atractiella rhizophila]
MAVGLLDYSVADTAYRYPNSHPTFEEWLRSDPTRRGMVEVYHNNARLSEPDKEQVKHIVKVALFSDALQQNTGNGIRSSILRCYRKEVGDDPEEREKSHLHDLPYLPPSWKRKKRTDQNGTLLTRCATLCLDVDAPTSTNFYDALLASPILEYERSIPPEAAESRLKRIDTLFTDEDAMGEWKERIMSLKNELVMLCAIKILRLSAIDRLPQSLKAGKEGEEDVKHILYLAKLAPESQECEAVLNLVAQWIVMEMAGKLLRQNVEDIGGTDQEADTEEALTPAAFVDHTIAALNFIVLQVKALGEGPFFDQVTDKASTDLVNTKENAANLVSAYIDEVLRKPGDPLQGSLNDNIKHALRIYSFLQQKDAFLELHARRLARRIAKFECIDEDKETEIAGLFSGAESSYKQKIIRMLAERQSSISLSRSCVGRNLWFKNNITDFNAIVLSSSASTFPRSECDGMILPKALEPLHDEFNQFFAREQRGRKVTHVLHLSTVELQTRYTTVKYTIQASIPQTAILLLFAEDKSSANLVTIAEEVGLTEKTVKRLLNGLVKQHLLLFENEEYHLNLQFASKKVRIPLHRLNADKDKDGISAVMIQVNKNRLVAIEAAVVRVMKCAKQLTRQSLVADTITALHAQFSPAVKDINIVIRRLEEKEILKKIDGETEKFAYVA